MRKSGWVVLLHGSLQADQQQQAFQKARPGVRKVVLSTNIAETSVTIPDVVYVVDSARQKEKGYDASTHCSSLLPVWISRDSMLQVLTAANPC